MPARPGVGDDARGGESVLVGGRARDLDLPARDPVPVGDRSRRDLPRADLHRLPVELRAEPPDGPRKADAVPLVPDHRLARSQRDDDLPEPLLERRRRRASPDVALANLQVVHRETQAAGESLGRLRRHSVRECDGLGGAAALLAPGRRVEALDHDRDPPGRHEHPPRAAEPLEQAFPELPFGPGAEAARKLLGPDLEQEHGHQAASSAGATDAR